MEIIRGIEQGSEEWNHLRIGSVGASSVSKIVTTKGKPSTQKKAYMYTLAAEIFTGKKTESFSNQHMKDGIEFESNTRMEFQLETLKEVEEVALIFPDGRPGYHCSPDGIIVGEEAGLELKSVIPSTQVKYLDKNKLPTEYILQCQMSMMVTGWDIWHFMSFCPGLPPLILEVERDDGLISAIHDYVLTFIYDLGKLVEKLKVT
jgi:predicted phage-related endonuclease